MIEGALQLQRWPAKPGQIGHDSTGSDRALRDGECRVLIGNGDEPLLETVGHDLVKLAGRCREDAARTVEDVGVFQEVVGAEPLLNVRHPLLEQGRGEPRGVQLPPERLGSDDHHEALRLGHEQGMGHAEAELMRVDEVAVARRDQRTGRTCVPGLAAGHVGLDSRSDGPHLALGGLAGAEGRSDLLDSLGLGDTREHQQFATAAVGQPVKFDGRCATVFPGELNLAPTGLLLISVRHGFWSPSCSCCPSPDAEKLLVGFGLAPGRLAL